MLSVASTTVQLLDWPEFPAGGALLTGAGALDPAEDWLLTGTVALDPAEDWALLPAEPHAAAPEARAAVADATISTFVILFMAAPSRAS
jgi:hypothetical protein